MKSTRARLSRHCREKELLMTRPPRNIPDNVRNVLVIMTDQHRTDTIGCLGNPHAHTPVIDAMGESRLQMLFI